MGLRMPFTPESIPANVPPPPNRAARAGSPSYLRDSQPRSPHTPCQIISGNVGASKPARVRPMLDLLSSALRYWRQQKFAAPPDLQGANSQPEFPSRVPNRATIPPPAGQSANHHATGSPSLHSNPGYTAAPLRPAALD